MSIHLFLRVVADILHFLEKGFQNQCVKNRNFLLHFELSLRTISTNAYILNQYTWTYLGDSGYSEVIGLYHSSKSGHLMIYVGKKVMVVDFNIRDSKTYSFFINDELCEVQLERKDLQMFYHFKINKDADTPRNKARKKTEKKYIKQSLAFFALIILAVILIAFYFCSNFKSAPATASEILNPAQTIGKIEVKTENKFPVITYFFVANQQSYNMKMDISANSKNVFANTFPINAGDEFMVEYDAMNPAINRILFDKPSQQQLNIYLNKVLQRHTEFNPNLTEGLGRCQLMTAYELGGMSALADFYYQKVSPADNSKHNRNTYQRLTRSLLFKKKVEKECW